MSFLYGSPTCEQQTDTVDSTLIKKTLVKYTVLVFLISSNFIHKQWFLSVSCLIWQIFVGSWLCINYNLLKLPVGFAFGAKNWRLVNDLLLFSCPYILT